MTDGKQIKEVVHAELSPNHSKMDAYHFQTQILALLNRHRAVDPSSIRQATDDGRQWSIPDLLCGLAVSLESNQKLAEAAALHEAARRTTTEKELERLGIGYAPNELPGPNESDCANAAFIVEALLLSLNSEASSRDFFTTSSTPCPGAKPMTLAQKIFAQHLIGMTQSADELRPDVVVRVGLDWVPFVRAFLAGAHSIDRVLKHETDRRITGNGQGLRKRPRITGDLAEWPVLACSRSCCASRCAQNTEYAGLD